MAFTDTHSRLSSAAATDNTDSWRTGWVLGAGLEYAVTNNVSIRGEYLHSDFGRYTVGYTANNVAIRHTLSDDALRLGVNYKF